MIKNVNAEVVNVTPAQAESWLNDFPYSGQRMLRKSHIKRLAGEMKAGRFGGNTVEVLYLNGAGYLVNGQHTLRAIIEYGESVPLTVVSKTADTQHDIDSQYTHIDIQLKRTNYERLKALRVHEILGLNPTHMNRFASAIYIIMSGFSIDAMARVSVEDQSDLMLAWKDDILHLYGLLSQSNVHLALTKKLMRRDILSVLLAVQHYYDDKDKVDSFVTGVTTGVALEENDPRLYLRQFAETSQAHGTRTSKNYFSTGYGVRYTARCWTHYVQGNHPKIIRVYEGSPVVIMGTPVK